MDQLSPQLMHKLVFTVLMHGLNDSQTNLALRVLTEALGHDNLVVRELAVVALADLPLPAARRAAPLTQAMGDASSKVRRRAARALGDMGAAAQAALPQLTAGLRDADASVRRDCAGTIGRLGPAAHPAATGLVGLLADPDERTRAVAAVALRRVGRGAVAALLDGVRSPSAEVRGRCAGLLGKVAPNDDLVAAVLRQVLADTDADVRTQADEALKLLHTPPPGSLPAVVRNELPAVVEAV